MNTDGLDPPGEQLELFPLPDVAEIVVHRVVWSPGRWSCVCGAGRAGLQGGAIAGAAARAHMRAVRRRMAARPERP